MWPGHEPWQGFDATYGGNHGVRLVNYYPRAMRDSGVTLAIWSRPRATAGAGQDVEILHGEEGTTGEHVFFEAEECGIASLAPEARSVTVPTGISSRPSTRGYLGELDRLTGRS